MSGVDWSKYTPIGKQTGLAVAGTAVSLTQPSGAKARAAIIEVGTAAIRFWVDGSTPTASEGHRADVAATIELNSAAEVANFKAIRESGVSAKLEITYFA